MLCPRCSKVVAPQAAFCPRCGLPLSADVEHARQSPADPDGGARVREDLIEHGRRFRFALMPPTAVFVIPIIILMLLMLTFGCCVIPVRF